MMEIPESPIVFFDDPDQTSFTEGYKLVPWLTWDEWDSVRESIFSSTADDVAFALRRISTWRTRGCVPAAVDVTASIIEIQQKDGFFIEKNPVAVHSEHLLQMLYCMAILRLVNCVIEKTRRRTEVSIADAAEAIGMPRKLIDLRHEGSHRELPALPVLRNAAIEAIEWLKSYYWEPQKQQLPFEKDDKAKMRSEVRSKIHKLAFCLQRRCNLNVFSSIQKEKCFKKNFRKILSDLAELFVSFSAEIIAVLLEFMLKALNSDRVKPQESSNGCQGVGGVLDEWGLVVLEFSKKEPELLLMLLETVLNNIEDEIQIYDSGHATYESEKLEHLCILFVFLVDHLKRLKNLLSVTLSSSTKLKECLRKCLLFTVCCNSILAEAALQLSEVLGGHNWKRKLEKLVLKITSDDFPRQDSESTEKQGECLDEAMKKLEFIKQQVLKNKYVHVKVPDTRSSGWVKAKEWNRCPIGMLPRNIGSSGRLPFLESASSHRNEPEEKKQSRKREAELSVAQLQKLDEDVESFSLKESRGFLLIDGTWRRPHWDEIVPLKSSVKILV